MTRRSKLLAALSGLVLFAGAARADDPPPPSAEADEHLRTGLTHYQAHDYELAIEQFRVGFSVEPRREFLFALGQAERLSGDCGSAILYYQAFVRSKPSTSQAAAAREQIEICHLLLATEKPKRKPDSVRGRGGDRDEPPPLSSQRARARAPARSGAENGHGQGHGGDLRSPWYTDVTGDVLLGGGVAMLAVGGGLFAASSSAASAAEDAATYPEYDALIDKARTRRTLALTAAGAGGALVGAAIWRYRWGRGHRVRTVAVAPAPGQVTVSVGGRF